MPVGRPFPEMRSDRCARPGRDPRCNATETGRCRGDMHAKRSGSRIVRSEGRRRSNAHSAGEGWCDQNPADLIPASFDGGASRATARGSLHSGRNFRMAITGYFSNGILSLLADANGSDLTVSRSAAGTILVQLRRGFDIRKQADGRQYEPRPGLWPGRRRFPHARRDERRTAQGQRVRWSGRVGSRHAVWPDRQRHALRARRGPSLRSRGNEVLTAADRGGAGRPSFRVPEPDFSMPARRPAEISLTTGDCASRPSLARGHIRLQGGASPGECDGCGCSRLRHSRAEPQAPLQDRHRLDADRARPEPAHRGSEAASGNGGRRLVRGHRSRGRLRKSSLLPQAVQAAHRAHRGRGSRRMFRPMTDAGVTAPAQTQAS